ncbi:unnamed protein product [Vitrella brassicaformis CCMP3155]|uniref:Glutathione reductase n=1 Tax=Vitrella brassicaformis (strain CCMP3155) TaxID=1169540 RepID=A0A0G4F1Z7_VITBC|nr:unnamed protein product [Vitrella brassicaformis CCMP3155]|eukprot:CEM05884.1 unnamed protein product [Vitrella brassicaformis CCMP3155]
MRSALLAVVLSVMRATAGAFRVAVLPSSSARRSSLALGPHGSSGRSATAVLWVLQRGRYGSSRMRLVAQADGETSFDYLVIGAGSGGIASARRAAGYGAKVAVVERAALGGTCVNVGCVPKKVMFNAASINEMLHEANHHGFTVSSSFDWSTIKTYRDNYIKRLNGIYFRNIENSGVKLIEGLATFTGPNSVRVGDRKYSAKNILIAVGGRPTMPDIPGAEHAINSDGFFQLEEMPKKVAVVGAGYIAVEMAGIFNALGSDTTLFVRGETALRKFDEMLRTHLDAEMRRQGMEIVNYSSPKSISKGADGKLTLETEGGMKYGPFDTILMATGRKPVTDLLNLDAAGVAKDSKGYIPVDEYSATNVPGVYAVGDVIGNVELTPTAIAAGRRLADRLFNGMPGARAYYDNVPTVIFSHPPIGTVGLSEEEAKAKYGDNNVKTYRSTFVNLYYGPFQIPPEEKPKSIVKLICEGQNERVVGLHVIGMGSDELLQGFGVAIKMGCTKADLDDCIAIHPTAAEEVVTLPTWGMSNAHVRKLKGTPQLA